MTLKRKLLRYFLPMVLTFSILSMLSTFSAVQTLYYRVFEKITLVAASKAQPEIYFKTKRGTLQTPADPNQVVLLFNSKAYLQSLLDKAENDRQKVAYPYKGFVIYITESYMTPLIFFLSLMLLSPNSWTNKLIAGLLGIGLILSFAYLSVHFKTIFLVADSGVTNTPVDTRDKQLYELLSYLFSNVTTITVAILTWILLTFNKNNIRLFTA